MTQLSPTAEPSVITLEVLMPETTSIERIHAIRRHMIAGTPGLVYGSSEVENGKFGPPRKWQEVG